MTNNVINNKVNEFFDKKIKFDYNYSLDKDYIKYPQPVVNSDLKLLNKLHVAYSYDL